MIKLTLKGKYINREGHTVQVIQTNENDPAGLFKIKNLRSGWEYWVGENGRAHSDSTPYDHRWDIVDIYTLHPTKDHMVLLRLIQKMGKGAFEGKFFDRLMKDPNKPPTMYQSELRLKELIEGNLVCVKPASKLKLFTLSDKALELLK